MRSIAALALAGLAALATPARAQETLEARAQLLAAEEAQISAQMSGRLRDAPFAEGQSFKAGELLVAFDCAVQRAELASAQAAAAGSGRVLAARGRLQALGSASEIDMAQAAAEAGRARAAVELAQARLRYCEIRAPWDGRVAQRHLRRHEFALDGKPLLDLVAAGPLRLRAQLPSAWVAWLRPGLVAELQVDETGTTHTATLERVGARVDTASLTVDASFTLTEPLGALLPGMSGTLRLQPPSSLAAAMPQ
ncbi:efflux RND transporter periplasmic adaptor subunit [Pseudoroseomonas cervicalis]